MIKALMIRNMAVRQREPVAPSVAQILPGQGEISPVPVRIAAGTQPPIDPKVRARPFTAVALILGPAIYRGLGGTGPVLDAALTYSGFVFAGAVPSWIVSLLAAALRGAGNVKFPAIVTLTSAAVLVLLSPALIFGIGPIPRLGIAGAGVAVTSFNVVAAIVLLRDLASGRALPVLPRTRLGARLFRSILGVRLLPALGTLHFRLTVLLLTGSAGP